MEAQGMNLFSLLPENFVATTGKMVLPGISGSVPAKPEFNFLEIFNQLTSQISDEPLTGTSGEIIPPVIFSDISKRPSFELPEHVKTVDFSGHHALPSLLPDQRASSGEQLPDSTSKTISSQESTFLPAQLANKTEPQSVDIHHGLMQSTPDINSRDNIPTKAELHTLVQNIPVKTIASEPDNIPGNVQSSKTTQNTLPLVEVAADKTTVQSQTAAQSLSSEIMQLTKAPERKAISSTASPTIPIVANSVESHSVAESPKSPTAETSLQAVPKQSASMPEVPLNRLGHTLIQMISKGEQKLEFRLDPPELGKLTMTVAMERDSVSVQVLTGSQTVRDLLLLQVDRLRNAMADESITLGQMSVDIGHQGNEDRRSATSSETLWMADAGSELGEFQTASVMFKAQGGRLLDHFV